MTDVASQLKRIPLFADLKGKDLKAVAELVKRTRHPAGSEICRQGRPGRTAYFVESGELHVIHVNPQGLRRDVGGLGPGSFFGETSLILGEPRDATIEVVQDATLLSLTRDDLNQLLHERPAILDALKMSPAVERKRYARQFKWQDPDEIVIVHLRKHKWVLIRNAAFPVFVLLVDLVWCGYWWYARSGGLVALIAGVLLGLIPLAFISYLYLDYANDNYVVTNKRVVHEERIFIFQESRVEAPLRAVQDIQESQEGLLTQWLDFGDLIIETAGERGHVVFREIPDPDGTRNAIFEQIQRVKAGARAEELAALRDVMRHHFGIPSPEKEVAAPAEVPKKRFFQLKPPAWLLASLRVLTYFLPPLR
ncbi:MAG: cyclic nucleotide-binding domain-containing protein, partial [Chloroflexi bacterium]|nr:cyclic nucleotide-binding domain-containing protein [Chloroflexota bacterium]